MSAREQRSIEDADTSRWYRIGVLIGIANLLFIALVVVLLEYDLLVGLAFAIVVSVLGGIGITYYALRQR